MMKPRDANQLAKLVVDKAADRFICALPDERYELLQPIPVSLERDRDEGWIARFDAATISMPGSSPEDAQQALSDDIVEAFELFLSEEDALGPLPQRQLSILQEYIIAKER